MYFTIFLCFFLGGWGGGGWGLIEDGDLSSNLFFFGLRVSAYSSLGAYLNKYGTRYGETKRD